MALELACLGPWEPINLENFYAHSLDRQQIAQDLPQFIQLGIRVKDQRQQKRVISVFVPSRHDTSIANFRQRGQLLLEFQGIQFQAANIDEVIIPAEKAQPGRAFQDPDIARIEPSILEHALGRLGVE